MKRRLRSASAFVLPVLLALAPVPVHALEEPDRLFMVGERAFADGLHGLSRRVLERFVAQYAGDPRAPAAYVVLGKARLALGEPEPALEAFRLARVRPEALAQPVEVRFWEGEALLRLKRYPEARAAYDDVLRLDAASPLAPDALFGFGWTELELKRPEEAVKAFRDLLGTWPDHPQAASAAFYQARALVDLQRYPEALPLLTTFAAKYPDHRLAPDAHYLLGWTRLASGDARAALADLRAFVAAHPEHSEVPTARRLLLETMTRHGGPEDLAEGYRTLMAQQPATAQGLADAAGIAARLGRPADQQAARTRLRAEFPDHPLALRAALEQGTAAFRDKDWKEAAAHAQAATASADDAVRAEAWLLVGESELKLKRYPSALKAFDAVAGVPGVDAGVRYRALAGTGLAREEQKDLKAALTAYEGVAARSPDDTLREWAEERAKAVRAQLARAAGPPAKKPAPPVQKPPAERDTRRKGG
jgi:tetratricopeptide (TPR) repeat protein